MPRLQGMTPLHSIQGRIPLHGTRDALLTGKVLLHDRARYLTYNRATTRVAPTGVGPYRANLSVIWGHYTIPTCNKKAPCTVHRADDFDTDRKLFRFDASLESVACMFLCPSEVSCYPSANFLGRVEGSGLQGVASLARVRVGVTLGAQ